MKYTILLLMLMLSVTSVNAEKIQIKNKYGTSTGYVKVQNDKIKEYNKNGTLQYTYTKNKKINNHGTTVQVYK